MIDANPAIDSEKELMNSVHKLADAGGSVIQVRTREPLRAALTLRKHLLGSDSPYKEWDVVNGFRDFTRDNFTEHRVAGKGEDFGEALSFPLAQLRAPGSAVNANAENIHFFVYVDPHPYIKDNPVAIEMLQQYAAILPSTNVCLLLVTPDMMIPGVPSGSVLVTDLKTPTLVELTAILLKIVGGAVADKSTFSEASKLTEADYHKIASMGLGLSLYEFETYAAISIIDASQQGEKKLTVSRLLEGIAKGKTAVVRQSEILSLTHAEDIENVGGMGRLKDWIAARANCYSPEAREFGVEPPKGMVLVGVPGCITGDTMLDYKRGKRAAGRPISLWDFHDKFNGISTSTRPWEDLTEPTYLHSLGPDGNVYYNRVISVIDAGMKHCIAIDFSDGSRLTLTPNHPVCVPGGQFIPAGQLEVGSGVLARGSMKPVPAGGRNLAARPPREIVNLKYHPHGSRRIVEHVYEYTRVARARLVVEAHMNHMSYYAFVGILQNDQARAESLTYLDPSYEVHHVDEDTLNDQLSNLMVLHKIDHAREHGKVENFNVEYVREVTVTGITSAGSKKTFDIQMDMPANNFVANGIIVHNTGKSLTARVVASILDVPLVTIDFSRVFSKYVGDSEERIQSALKMVEGMAPVVLFGDEIDKGLGGAGDSNDSGTSSRVLGSFLTWLQDCKAPVFTILTANRVDGLPPELLRRGRFDQIFSVGLPSATERREVLEIHLRKRGRSIEDFTERSVTEFLQVSDTYVPAEIESAVKDGLVAAFNDNEAEGLEMRHILDALKGMVPMSKSHKESIDRMVSWAASHATSVSYPEAPVVLGSLPGQARIIRASRKGG